MSTDPDDGDGKVDDPGDADGREDRREDGEASEPPDRPSAMQLLADPEDFPHDGKLAAVLRRVDRVAGKVEQVVLVGVLATVVMVGVAQTFATKLFGHSFLWSFDAVRAGTFTIAMLGAAFASHQARHLSMDLVSRKLSPKLRQIVRLLMGTFTVAATSLFFYSGVRLTSALWNEAGSHAVPPHLIALMIPVGCVLIIFHTLLHLLIDVDYMLRGKLPPEKAMSAH